MASPTQWAWVWVNSGSWWWTGRPGMLHSMWSQRVGHDWVTELNREQFLQTIKLDSVPKIKERLFRWHSDKEHAYQCRKFKRCRLNLQMRKIPWRRKWQPTPIFLPGKFHGLVGYSPWGHKESTQLSNWAHKNIEETRILKDNPMYLENWLRHWHQSIF